jgi:DNA excision repair protein ERCC-2
MFSRIAEKILSVIEGSVGGVGVFTPSYQVLEAILPHVLAAAPGRNILFERRGMSSEEAAGLSDSFRSQSEAVLFGVQGGRFSEGEDFRGGLMGTVIVAGLAIPPPSPLLFVEYEHLKLAGEGESFLMLSRLPALRKAFQSAGRHIRNPGRRGLVFLLDSRFGSEVVRDLMPSWLRRDLHCGDFSPEGLRFIASEFWGSASRVTPS